jgi:hypothetical protein
MAKRTTFVAAALMLIGSAVGAQVITPQPVGSKDGDLAKPASKNPCVADWMRCPDPMTLDTRPTLLSSDLPAPDAKPEKPPRDYSVRRKLVLFQNGKLIQIKTTQDSGYVGGTTWVVKAGAAPWMAQIQRPLYVQRFTSDRLQWDVRHFCGGAKIAPGWILTAAHCVTDQGIDIRAIGYRVRLGMTDIRDGRSGASYKIVRVIPNPNYGRPTKWSNDIALVQYAADAETARADRSWIETIAIDADRPETKPHGGKEAWVYGWGKANDGNTSALLRYGKIKLQPDSNCNNPLIALCGRGEGAQWSSQCKGDSGGPLIVHYGKVPVLVGLVSNNQGKAQACGENVRQGYYTRVASARDWIQGYTGRLPQAPVLIQRR